LKTFRQNKKPIPFIVLFLQLKMDKIITHIENLLIQNDYVIVPALGGFTLSRQSAKIHAAEIIPPFASVSFNARMNHSDGLLAVELMRSENISYREANKLIEAEVEKINAKLHKKNEIAVGKLGYLCLNEEKKTAFRAAKNTDFLPCNFGLKPLHIAKRKTENEPRKVVIMIPRNREIFRYAAVALILIGIFLFSPKTGDGTLSHFAGWNNNLLTTLNAPVNFESEKEETAPEKIIVEEEITAETQELPKIYHIIVACLTSRQSADRFRDRLYARHFENARVLPARTTNRIAIDSFSDRETALLYLRQLRRTNREFGDAWLHREKVACE
jgi:nucleoid DNA-binding protein